MANYEISMAAGIMPEATPEQLIEAAANAEFDYGGMWIEKDLWDSAQLPKLRKKLSDTGLKLLDCEVAWLQEGEIDPWLLELVDITAELGAPNLLCVSSDPEADGTAEKLQQMADRAKGTGVRINLEYALFTEVKSLGAAMVIMRGIDSDNKGILCDTLHFYRTGTQPSDLSDVPRELFGYAQLCDAGPQFFKDADDTDGVIEEAVDMRRPMGEGQLDIAGMVGALPGNLPYSIEERSKPLRDDFPDLNARARECARTTRAWFAKHHG